MTLTAERLRELLHYDPKTGIFTWLVSRRVVRAGDQAGTVKEDGYLYIKIDQRSHLGHRLAWLYMTGKWPPDQVDHRDLVGSHNWWENLRLADNSQNNANSECRAASGIKGVTWVESRKRWQAQITVHGRNIFLGRFSEAGEAAAAYATAARAHFGEFARVPDMVAGVKR